MKRHTITVKSHNRKRPIWLATGGIALALIVAGCGSTYGSNQPAGRGSTVTSAPTAPKAASAAAARSVQKKTGSTGRSTRSLHASAARQSGKAPA